MDDPAKIEQIRAVRADRLSKLWDPQTGRRRRSGSGSGTGVGVGVGVGGVGVGVGDPAIVGVARPADYSDPNLTTWLKDPHNPISITNARGAYAGPSTMWEVGGGAVNMVMNYDHHISLFSSTDPAFHTWTVKNSDFYVDGSGPSEFFAIPAAAPSAGVWVGDGPKPTHVLSGIVAPPPYRGGTAWYTLGVYNSDTGDRPLPAPTARNMAFVPAPSAVSSSLGKYQFLPSKRHARPCFPLPSLPNPPGSLVSYGCRQLHRHECAGAAGPGDARPDLLADPL